MSRPIVVTACMVQSSESGRPRRPWHLRAGGGAVHSIICGSPRRTSAARKSGVRSLLQSDYFVEGRLPIYSRLERRDDGDETIVLEIPVLGQPIVETHQFRHQL